MVSEAATQGEADCPVNANLTVPLEISVLPGVYTGCKLAASSNVPLPFVVHNKVVAFD